MDSYKKDDILKQAELQAKELITEATRKAQHIIREAELFSRRTQEDLARTLEETAKDVSAANSERVELLLANYEKKLAGFLSKAEEKMEEHLAVATDRSSDHLINIEKKLGEGMKSEYKELLAETKKLQNDRLEQIEAKAQSAIPQIIKEAIGAGISVEGHEKVIREALRDIQYSSLWTLERNQEK